MAILIPTKNFKIRSIGVQDVDVYDIEVENNHNFFTKGSITDNTKLLVHNSNYLSLEEVIEKLGVTFESFEAFDNWMLKFIDEVLQPEIDRALEDYAFSFGIPNIIKFGYEKVIWSMFVTGGKNYALSMVRDDDKTFYDKPKVKVTGIPIKKKNSLDLAKLHMSKVLEMVLMGTTKSEVIEYLRPIKEELKTIPLEDLAILGKLNDYDKYAYPIKELVKNGLKFKLKTPARNKGAVIHNYIINIENVKNVYPIGNDTMCKYCQVKPDNKFGVECIVWEDKLPPEFKEWFEPDYETIWEKGFLKLLDTWFDRLEWGTPKFEIDEIADFLGF